MRQATNSKFAAVTCAIAASILLAACAGNGNGLDANGQPLTPNTQGNAPLTADFDSIQAQIFTPICTVCHAGADAPHGLRLDAADSYALLVGVPSVEVPDLLRVKPGDPDNSYIIQKLEGHAAVGARMPLGGPYLSSDVVAVIRQWITDGALNSTSATPASFSILNTAPAVDEVLHDPPPQIMVAFSHELDVTHIEPESVRLEKDSHTGDATITQIVPSHIQIPYNNPRTLLLWPFSHLSNGHYRVIAHRGVTNLTDISGTSLQTSNQSSSKIDDSSDVAITSFDIEAKP